MNSNRMVAAALIACVTFFSPAAVFADGFPGKGSASDWGDALPYYNQGNRYLNRGDFDWAETRFKDAIAIYPYDPDFYVNLGTACTKQSKLAEAEEAFRKAAELNPKDWAPWSNIANVYVKQDKLIESLDLFKKTLKLNPPPAEKTAIENNIRDITKILRVTGKLPVADASGKNTDGKVGAGKFTVEKTGVGKTAAGKTETKSSPPAKSGAPDKQSIQGSGWDYVYGH